MSESIDDLVREVTSYVAALQAENAKLREQLAKARDPQRIGGQADPGSFAYAIEQLREFRWQHATNDEDAIPYINNVADAHRREVEYLEDLSGIINSGLDLANGKRWQLVKENAKLRELCSALYKFAYDEYPDGAELNFADRMREFGIEVEP